MERKNYHELNAQLNLFDENGKIQFEKDKEAAHNFFVNEDDGINSQTVFFHDLEEKTKYLIDNGHWDEEVVLRYGFDKLKELFKYAHSFKHRFKTFFGAEKFFKSYAMRTNNGERFLERFEDRAVLTAVAHSTNFDHAKRMVKHIVEGRFQPATPTFLNAGRAAAGGPTSCYLLRTDDNMESIGRGQTDALQLSKRGGGVAFSLTNIRETGAPIKNIEGQSSGIVPVMKILEDSFTYADQLGQRSGAGAVYLNVHHPDILKFLDTKRENADEKIRIKTLSLGIMVPDVTFELLKTGEDMYLFSPYDIKKYYGKDFTDISITEWYDTLVADERIKKTKVSARKLFQTIAEIQFESGYPYLVFEDTANEHNPVKNIGRIQQSNLCSEILQPQTPSTFNAAGEFEEVGRDIACNLGSLNVALMNKATPGLFAETVEDAVEFLSNVAAEGDFSSSPTVEYGNSQARAIGLGQMNLHGHFIEQGIRYNSEEAIQEWRRYIRAVTYHAISKSVELSRERSPFNGFEGSGWQNGEVVNRIIDDIVNTENPEDAELEIQDWEALQKDIENFGMFNQHLQAIPPTGSISYINHSTSSIHPIAAKIEIRKEGKLGRVYYPAYGLTNENFEDVETAYDMGPNAVIDMYAASTPYVDQGQSLTLFFNDTATTRDLNRAHNYAHKSGVKTLYYVRIAQQALAGTEVQGCVSCML